jgi:hypothetical protein
LEEKKTDMQEGPFTERLLAVPDIKQLTIKAYIKYHSDIKGLA